MNVWLNDDQQQLLEPISLLQMLDGSSYQAGIFAVALNGDFIPKSRYADVQLKDGDRIELVAPMQGG